MPVGWEEHFRMNILRRIWTWRGGEPTTVRSRYNVKAARKNTALTPAELDAIADKGTIEDFQGRLRSDEERFDPDTVGHDGVIPT